VLRSIAALLALALPLPAAAWGPLGHRLVNRAAIRALPGDGPVFLLREIDWIGDRGAAPDSWRVLSTPFARLAEDPNHGWFMEQFRFLDPVPRSRWEFVLALYDEHRRLRETDPERAALVNVRWTGTLPYAAAETQERLQAALRSYRQLTAGGGDGRSALRSALLDAAYAAGWLGHYAGDGAMPLHTSIHHDGWVGENPEGYTREPAIHGRFESRYVEAIAPREEELLERMPPPRYVEDAFSEVLRFLERSHGRVEDVYRLDRDGALVDPAHPEARELTLRCLADAAALLRDLIYSAWLDSAEPPGRASSPEENPIDPAHPGFNPATGSAPAR